MRRKTARKKSSRTSGSLVAMGGAPAKRSSRLVVVVLGALVLVNLYVFVWDKDTSVAAIKEQAAAQGTGPGATLAMPVAALTADPLVADAPRGSAVGSAATRPVGPPGIVDDKVAKADTLGRLLKRSGLTAPETDEVIRSLTGTLDFRTIRVGQSYRIERGPSGRVEKFQLVVSKVLTVRAERQPNGQLLGIADAVATKVETVTLGGKIESSLYAALKAASSNEPPGSLVDFFVDVFAYDLDFYNDTHEGDTFRVVVEKELTETGAPLRYKRILAAEYAGKAGTFSTYYFMPTDAYFTHQGESAEKTLLKTPLKFSRVSSKFDRKRMHPVLHTTRAHLGVDYAAPTGTPVWAAASGTITTRAPAGGAGNLVTLKHDGGIETLYMHLDKFAPNQKVGQKVAAKTVIGYVGTTGLSTGPHLHFGVKHHGSYTDPSKLAPIRGKKVPAKHADAFHAEVSRLDALLANAKL